MSPALVSCAATSSGREKLKPPRWFMAERSFSPGAYQTGSEDRRFRIAPCSCNPGLLFLGFGRLTANVARGRFARKSSPPAPRPVDLRAPSEGRNALGSYLRSRAGTLRRRPPDAIEPASSPSLDAGGAEDQRLGHRPATSPKHRCDRSGPIHSPLMRYTGARHLRRIPAR